MTRHTDIAGAVALHGWAGPLLLHGADGPPPAVDAAAWRLFLRADACALPLAQRLDALGATTALAPTTRDVLAAAAAAELRRSLSAHRQLRLLAELARARGLPIVVLKGGLAVADGQALDLNDVDVLPAPGRARELAEALDANGYGSLAADAAGEWHLAGRIAQGGIRIEIHEWINGSVDATQLVGRAMPLAAYPPLRRPAPADHLWHVLFHAVVHHPERRGRLRDRLLLAHAVAACPASALTEVQARAEASPRAGPLVAALADMLDAAHREPANDAAVAARLALIARFPRYRRRQSWRTVMENALVLASTERPWCTELWEAGLAPRFRPSALGGVAWIEAHAPHAGRAARLATIAIRAVVTASLAAYAVVAGRRAARSVARHAHAG